MTKFTPGPWVTRAAKKPDNVGGYDCAVMADKYIIAEAYEVVDDGVKVPVSANARLIASAPDMYEALDLLMRIMQAEDPWDRENLGSMNEACRKARAALSKAEGAP